MGVTFGAEVFAFWLLGLLNNSGHHSLLDTCFSDIAAQYDDREICAGYVIMIAGANEISSGSVGLVYFCAIFPALLVKLTAPYWCGLPSMHALSTCNAVIDLNVQISASISNSRSLTHPTYTDRHNLMHSALQVPPDIIPHTHEHRSSYHVVIIPDSSLLSQQTLAAAWCGVCSIPRWPRRGLLPRLMLPV